MTKTTHGALVGRPMEDGALVLAGKAKVLSSHEFQCFVGIDYYGISST